MKEAVVVPGLTYVQLLRYAARLRMKTFSYSEVESRVNDLLEIMDLQHCKNRKIGESPSKRGVQGGELRRLTIACELVSLPLLLVLEEPALDLEVSITLGIFKCLQTLAKRGHIVVCSIPKPPLEILPLIDNLVVLASGFSVFSANPSHIEPYYCSTENGYVKKPDVHVIDFIYDIANGTERAISQRTADPPALLQTKFESCNYFSTPSLSVDGSFVRGLPDQNYFLLYLSSWKTFFSFETIRNFIFDIIRVYLVVERAVYVKITDYFLLVRSFLAACIVSSIIGYLQFDQGNYGYYTMTLAHFPYYGTANTTAVLFFVSAYTFAQQVLNVQLVCQAMQMFRYEQFSGASSAFGYLLAQFIADVPVIFVCISIFASIVYFMTTLNYDYHNYLYFVYVLNMNALVALVTTYLFAALLKKEIPVRDLYLLVTFMLIILSGFPFQLPFIRDYFSEMSQINPVRWTFEALMNWKFATNYEDGDTYLTQFSMATFHPYKVFPILANFLYVSLSVTYLLLWPVPYFLHRKKVAAVETRSMSQDSDFGENEDVVNPLPPPRMSESKLQRPVIFDRETSITSKSQLSINVSVTGAHENQNQRGPTVEFKRLSYMVRDRFSPLGVKSILNNVSGKFDWGKLSMVLGASSSGRSSLLHILAGDIGFQSEVTGDILYDGVPANPKTPLWERCAFVEAHDEQCRDITVRDVVTYAMKLRCPKRALYSVVADNVTKTLELLHLSE